MFDSLLSKFSEFAQNIRQSVHGNEEIRAIRTLRELEAEYGDDAPSLDSYKKAEKICAEYEKARRSGKDVAPVPFGRS